MYDLKERVETYMNQMFDESQNGDTQTYSVRGKKVRLRRNMYIVNSWELTGDHSSPDYILKYPLL